MTGIGYSYSAEGLTDDELSGFFVGWSESPSNDLRRRMLLAASEIVIARADDGMLVGFITAVTDGVFAAFIPLLEVRAEHRGQGIGRSLVTRMLSRLRDFYSIDLVCDDDVIPFYEKLGGQRLHAVAWRNFAGLTSTS